MPDVYEGVRRDQLATQLRAMPTPLILLGLRGNASRLATWTMGDGHNYRNLRARVAAGNAELVRRGVPAAPIDDEGENAAMPQPDKTPASIAGANGAAPTGPTPPAAKPDAQETMRTSMVGAAKTVAAYRQELVEGGFSVAKAEEMAQDLNNALMLVVFRGLAEGAKRAQAKYEEKQGSGTSV